MADTRRDLAARRASFLTEGNGYERYRPGYPEAAIKWVVHGSRQRIVDVGCGPGNLTVQLAEAGHEVVGADPSTAMLGTARRRGLNVVRGVAEALPFVDACADVVTAATAFHWFDHERAVLEMRRVLRSGGRVALLTNMRDESVPWVRALSQIIGSEAAMGVTLGGADGMEEEFTATLERRGSFRSTQWRIFDHVQELTPEDLVGLVRTRSYIAILPPEEREQLLEGVRELCRTHVDLRGKRSFVLPYKTHVCRSGAS
ncbi:MAG: methyltransferase domain-containing protein [Actinomycetota bacterium]|nr:methyltransferase domain-containing protein [Actinomycetota bacterium]